VRRAPRPRACAGYPPQTEAFPKRRDSGAAFCVRLRRACDRERRRVMDAARPWEPRRAPPNPRPRSESSACGPVRHGLSDSVCVHAVEIGDGGVFPACQAGVGDSACAVCAYPPVWCLPLCATRARTKHNHADPTHRGVWLMFASPKGLSLPCPSGLPVQSRIAGSTTLSLSTVARRPPPGKHRVARAVTSADRRARTR
jgi:hypothetical protein